tara:strand:+ start:2905 stop:3825 length:921 start_codon:yes stop_codon:yes gene_type:complete
MIINNNIIQKFRKYINNRILRTPGVEFLLKNNNLNDRKKHINFWINKAKNKKSFQKYFFSEKDTNNKKISFKILENKNYLISDEIFKSLASNGIVILENALPDEERNEVIDFFSDLRERNFKDNRWLKEPNDPGFFKEVDEIMGETVIKNFKELNNLSNQFSKEIYGKLVEPTVQFRYLKQTKEKREEKVKGASYLHTDRFLPHFKIYYTPYEITNDDAPLEYVLSSHKINENFINFYLQAKNFDETDELFKTFQLETKTVCVPKNSLYIAFTNGFHKRTPFNNKSERALVFLQYVQRFNKFDYLF